MMIATFLWVLAACAVHQHKGSTAAVIPVGNHDTASSVFSVTAGNEKLATAQYKDFHYASFQQQGKADVLVKCSEEIRQFKISPLSKNIEGKLLDAHTLTFHLEQPSYVVVTVNNRTRLFLFADNEAVPPSNKVVNILSYTVDTSGRKLNTVPIQKAINETAQKGQTLLFPAGIYKTGRLTIPSNSKIVLDAGALLKASDDITDLESPEGQKPRGFINLLNARNVEIKGLGVIDGNGRYLREKFGDQARMRLLFLSGCTNVSINGITQRDPGSWNTQVMYSNNVTFKKVKLLNDAALANTDGFDPDASSFVTIEDCFGYCGDDNVAIKITQKKGAQTTVSDITVRGCVFLTRKSSLKVGTESRGESFKNILFENNDVIQSDRGMALYCADGALFDNIRYVNNRFEENYADAKRSGLFFQISKRNPDSEVGSMKNILVQDCSFVRSFPNPSTIEGFDEAHRVEVKINNLVVGGEKRTSLPEAGIKTTFANVVLY